MSDMHHSIVEHVAFQRGQTMAGDVTEKLEHTLLQLEELLYLVGDRPEPASEDEIMNYIIGIIESVKIKKSQIKVAQSQDVS